MSFLSNIQTGLENFYMNTIGYKNPVEAVFGAIGTTTKNTISSAVSGTVQGVLTQPTQTPTGTATTFDPKGILTIAVIGGIAYVLLKKL